MNRPLSLEQILNGLGALREFLPTVSSEPFAKGMDAVLEDATEIIEEEGAADVIGEREAIIAFLERLSNEEGEPTYAAAAKRILAREHLR